MNFHSYDRGTFYDENCIRNSLSKIKLLVLAFGFVGLLINYLNKNKGDVCYCITKVPKAFTS